MMMRFKVTKRGNIEDSKSNVLYFAEDISFLGKEAKKRLAELHSQIPSLQWEGSKAEGRKGAQDYLIKEGLLEA